MKIVELRQREQDRERQKRDWELKERQREESRLREEEALRRQQDEMQHRLRQQEDEMRRRQQENTMFMQEQNVDSTPPDFRRPLQPPPIFDRPMMNGPHNLMDLQMVRQFYLFVLIEKLRLRIVFQRYFQFKKGTFLFFLNQHPIMAVDHSRNEYESRNQTALHFLLDVCYLQKT